jgi:hypothetical protein
VTLWWPELIVYAWGFIGIGFLLCAICMLVMHDTRMTVLYRIKGVDIVNERVTLNEWLLVISLTIIVWPIWFLFAWQSRHIRDSE